MTLQAYQFTLIRYQHDATAGELVNVGIALWTLSTRELLLEIPLRHGRLSRFFADFDGSGFKKDLARLRSILRLQEKRQSLLSTPIFCDAVPPPTLVDFIPDSILDGNGTFKISKIMDGVSEDCNVRLQELAEEFLYRHEQKSTRARREDADIRCLIQSKLEAHGLGAELNPVTLAGKNVEHEFQFGWLNGKQNVLEGISLDYLRANDIKERAELWSGRLYNIGTTEDFSVISIVSPPAPGLESEYRRAIRILQDAPHMRKVLNENEFDDFIPTIASEIKEH